MARILSADIGATNSRFGFFESDGESKLSVVKTEWFKTADFSSFVGLVQHLRDTGFPLDPDDAEIAVFAIAGPVENGTRSSPPYISWDVDLSYLKGSFDIKRSLLINDFVAQAYASRSPVGQSAEKILPGKIATDGTIGIIGAGTALGKAALVPLADGVFLAVPSEGGHASFPFESAREDDFREFLKKKLGLNYITANIVVSGRGLSLVHEFLTGELLRPEEVAAKAHWDSETVIWAARLYGRACRNFALDMLALGGLYIAGGVAAKTPRVVKHESFAAEFRNSATMGALLEKIPVFLIDNEESGLWGAAFLGAQELKLGKRAASGR